MTKSIFCVIVKSTILERTAAAAKICMNFFLTLAYLFFLGSLLGWGLELIFRKFFSEDNPEHKWINPGFLVGPYLPIYGFGLCSLYLLARFNWSFIGNALLRDIVIVLFMAAVMTLIELIAGLIFIHGMKVRLWDYSSQWGNFMGLICPLFSLFWGILGAAYYFLVDPYILRALEWLANNLAFSFVIGFFFGIFTLDVIYSMQLVVKIRKFAAENHLAVHFEQLKLHIKAGRAAHRQKSKFLFAFSTDRPLSEYLQKYKENWDVKQQALKEAITTHTKRKK